MICEFCDTEVNPELMDDCPKCGSLLETQTTHPDYDPTPENQADVTSGTSVRERDELVKPR